MHQIGKVVTRIVIIVVWMVSFCAGARIVSGNETDFAGSDELSDIIRHEVSELAKDLEQVESLDRFNECVHSLSQYSEFAETSMPQVIRLLKGNTLRKSSPGAFSEESFRQALLQYFDSIGPSAIAPLIQLAADSSMDERTRVVASKAIGMVAKNARVKSSSFASMIESILQNESAKKNTAIYHNLLYSYSEVVEPSDASQRFLLEIVTSDDFQAKMFGIEVLCKTQKKSPIVLKTIVRLFQELEHANQLQANLPHSFVEGYGELGLFDETIDSYLHLESRESNDPIWRIRCLESMIKTRANSAVPRTQVLSELQGALNTRPVSPLNCVIINRALALLENWDVEHLKDAEPLLINCVEESSLEDLQAVAFELLDKLRSDRLGCLAVVSAKSQDRGLRFLALRQLHSVQRPLDAEDISFLIEFAISDNELLDDRVDAFALISSFPDALSGSLDQLETVWQNPGPPKIRFAAYRLCDQIRKQ